MAQPSRPRPISLAALLVLAALVTPTRTGSKAPVASIAPPCGPPEGDGLVDLDAGTSRQLPAVFPESWRRAPCPPGLAIRRVRDACFVATKEKPPCSYGYEHAGECLVPGAAAKPFPSSIGR